MSCTLKILNHIDATPVGQPFCTRECLKYGSRTAVDKTLARLVQKNVIIRLAYGVFMRIDADTKLPSIMEIAKLKSAAFGKELVEYGGSLACKLGLTNETPEHPTFNINGSSTSFLYLRAGTRIVLKSASKKRMQLKETTHGKIVRALWNIGKASCSEKLVDRVLGQCAVPEIKKMLALSKAWMPAWLANFFPTPHVFTVADSFNRDILYDSNFAPASST